MEDKKMDEKLQQIFKIQPLQAKCITYRTSTNEYRKMVKQSCISELKNLVNVEICIEQVVLKLPDEEQLPPPITGELRKPKVDSLLKECSVLDECLQLL